MQQEILLLGNEELYEISKEVIKGSEEPGSLAQIEQDLHDTLMAYREKHHAGRAIAAPQIGIKKRILYMNIDEPILFINPWLTFPDEEQMKVLDDCMSFPGLYVRVMRYKRCVIHYFDRNFKPCEMALEGDLSELIQHEYDHLDGILATMRAIDDKSLVLKMIGNT